MAHFKIDCRKCINCLGHRCRIYGENPNIAVEKCANDIFKNYIDISDCKECAFNSNDSYCTRYNDGLKHSVKKCNEKKPITYRFTMDEINDANKENEDNKINMNKENNMADCNTNYNTLTIEMTDGSSSTWKDSQWDDWDIIGDFLVVLDKDGKWIGMRNKSMIKKVDMYHG